MIGQSPIWILFEEGAPDPVYWGSHPPNPRFAIPYALSQDLVLDRETGLVWARNANAIGQSNWLDASTRCREISLGNRCGWRLPSVEELSSLVHLNQTDLALPVGHPFQNVQYGSGIYPYWTSTNHENPDGVAWFVNFWRGAGDHLAGLANKSLPGHVWPVRGGVPLAPRGRSDGNPPIPADRPGTVQHLRAVR